jgi:hypothetical protein
MSGQQPTGGQLAANISDLERKTALKRIELKRAFWRYVAWWLLVSAGMVVIWLLSGRGYFWPIWVLLGMGVGVLAVGFGIFGPKGSAPSEAQIERQIDKM